MKTTLAILAALLLSACMHVVSDKPTAYAPTPQSRISFHEVRTDAEKYKGATLALDGVILGQLPSNDSSALIEIMQVPLNSYGYPVNMDLSEGRFIARFANTPDASIYGRGRTISVTGVLSGKTEVQTKDGERLPYVVVDISSYYLWTGNEGYASRPYYSESYSIIAPPVPLWPFLPLLWWGGHPHHFR